MRASLSLAAVHVTRRLCVRAAAGYQKRTEEQRRRASRARRSAAVAALLQSTRWRPLDRPSRCTRSVSYGRSRRHSARTHAASETYAVVKRAPARGEPPRSFTFALSVTGSSPLPSGSPGPRTSYFFARYSLSARRFDPRVPPSRFLPDDNGRRRRSRVFGRVSPNPRTPRASDRFDGRPSRR